MSSLLKPVLRGNEIRIWIRSRRWDTMLEYLTSPAGRWALAAFFTVVFLVFYAIAFSILMGIRDNYRRYAQKAELQWTGPGRRTKPARLPLLWLFGLSLLSALVVVFFLIF